MFPVAPVDGFRYFGDKPAEKKSELDMETFMRLLIVQLTTQDPLEPMNDRDFFAQMAQLGQVQGMHKMQESMDMAEAGNLIGKTVTAVRPFTETGGTFDTTVTGRVEGMTVRNGQRIVAIVEADGGIVEVKLEAIRNVFVDDGIRRSLELSQAVSLIGKTVTATNPNDDLSNPDDDFITGVVERLSLSNGTQVIGVRISPDELVDVSLSAISRVEQ